MGKSNSSTQGVSSPAAHARRGSDHDRRKNAWTTSVWSFSWMLRILSTWSCRLTVSGSGSASVRLRATVGRSTLS
jgi:hypothetical protein